MDVFICMCDSLYMCMHIRVCALVCMYSQRPEEGTEASVTGSFELAVRCGPPSVDAGKQT